MRKSTEPAAAAGRSRGARCRRPAVFLPFAGVLACAVASAAAAAPPGEENGSGVAVLPPEVRLHGPAARQRVLVERRVEGRSRGELREGAELRSADPSVARVEDGVVVPVSDGTTAVIAEGELPGGTPFRAEAPVRVEASGRPVRWSFRHHVEAVLTKSGCNAGACHGASAGKNGFKLSLRGYDPAGDHRAITRHARGRRIELEAPARSLVLTKPTGAVPHKGGVRFAPGSLEWRILAEWIAAGAPAPSEDDAELLGLEVHPRRAVLSPGEVQRLVVLARYDDGRVEDVTRWAKYGTTSSAVATVDPEGRVEVAGHGEAAITVWHLSRIAVATITSPFPNRLPGETFTGAERRNFIDDLVLEKLRDLRLAPSPVVDDAGFLRRAMVDTLGVLPTPEEVRAFLADPRPSREKREALIDELVERPEFVDYWSYFLSDLLLVSSNELPAQAMRSYARWVRRHVAANTPWDAMVRELVTAEGSTLANGAAGFFVLHEDPAEMAETTSLAFLGTSIGCAKCHNHPLDRWTNDEYYAMANLFARVRIKNGARPGERVVYDAPRGDVVQPLTGKPQPPTPLDGEALPFHGARERRQHLADWLVDPSNPWFARAFVNRVWANFLGAGIVDPVDDLRRTNPPSHAALLDALAGRFVEDGFDLRALVRTILRSATYQRSSAPAEGSEADRRFYARYYPRRLRAEVLLDAFSQVTGAPSRFPGYPEGWRALELPDTNVASDFLRSFGRPAREQTCSCERSDEPSVAQALHLANGDTLDRKLRAAGNRLERRLAEGVSDAALVEEAWLAALGRLPEDRERREAVSVLAEATPETRREALEDIYWSLLSSREFLFNH